MRIKTHLLRRASAMLLCALAVATASAQVQYLIVSRTDGSYISFALADNPVVKNTSSELTVETTGSSIAVPFEELDSYSFSETPIKGVEEITTEEQHSYRDGQVTFNGLKPGSEIYVYALDGREVKRGTADADGYSWLDLRDLGTGVYIVRTRNSSFKFIVK